METKIENIKLPVSFADTPLELLMRVVPLLIYSKEWVIEKKYAAEEIILMKRINSTGTIEVIFKEFDLLDHYAELCFTSDNSSIDEFNYAIRTVKGCFVFLQNKQNEFIVKRIGDETAPEWAEILFAPIKNQLADIELKLNGISKEPAYFLLQAMNIVSKVIPDILDYESRYWGEIQPLPENLNDILVSESEEKINLALGLELEPIDAARANFMLMTLWLTRRISEGRMRWKGEAVQNIPDIKPLARQIIVSAKKHLIRDSRSLESLFVLRLQRAAYYFLNERENMGEAEHTIAKLRSLINAGFIEAEKKDSGEENSIKRRNDGKALEEDVKELLQSMGLKAAMTRTTGDGGIDIIAYSDSPVFSGKYVVQCKDWAGSVGEGVIRDLYGVVTAEFANKGILITTGTITKSAQKFAEGKPLELIDGEQLSKLLHKYKTS